MDKERLISSANSFPSCLLQLAGVWQKSGARDSIWVIHMVEPSTWAPPCHPHALHHAIHMGSTTLSTWTLPCHPYGLHHAIHMSSTMPSTWTLPCHPYGQHHAMHMGSAMPSTWVAGTQAFGHSLLSDTIFKHLYFKMVLVQVWVKRKALILTLYMKQ